MKWCSALVFCALVFSAASAEAQFDTAQVSGAIQDNTGGVLPGVDVVLVAEGTGLERRAVTNESGSVHVPERSGRRLPDQRDAVRLQAGRAGPACA